MNKLVFMGTSYFAEKILEYLITFGYEVVLVVTQPDRKSGRKQEIVYSPIKKLALAYNLPVFQPIKLKEDYQEIINTKANLIITCAYGQFLPKALIDMNVLNIHASMLPIYRGAAPMHRAIINGDKQTGISLMKSELTMDSGPVYVQKTVDIFDDDTVSSLQERLIVCSIKLIQDNLEKIINNDLVALAQNENEASFALTLKPEDEYIDFNRDFEVVYNHIRGLIQWPIGYSMLAGKKIKFFAVEKLSGSVEKKDGEVLGLVDDCLAIAVSGRILGISTLQVEGKQKMSAKDYFNGQAKNIVGECFGI